MPTSRRSFLQAAAVAAGGTAIAGIGRAEKNDRPLRVGLIGAGKYGMTDAKAALSVGGVEVKAICDVDSKHLATSAQELETLQGMRPKTYKRHEDLLAESELDAVIIASPTHWHAIHFLASLERGLDIYCEKPLAYDIREGRAMVDAAAKTDRVVQIGFQRRQSPALKEAAAFVADGGIGDLVQVDAQIHYAARLSDPTPQDPPTSLDWDRWCGPAPLIPYSPQVGHYSWRLEKTTGHGHLVDWGVHRIDTVRTMLGLAAPKRVTAAGGIYRHQGKITTPDTLTVHFEFDRVPLVWRHRLWGATEYTPETNNGVFLYGTRGTVFAADAKWIFIPHDKTQEREQHDTKADLGVLHMADFIECVRTRREPSCPIADGHVTTTAVQLAMIAHESDSVVHWDPKTETIRDNAAASALMRRVYRRPWMHPSVASL